MPDASPPRTGATPHPHRVSNAQELRALAHPLRLRLLEELVVNDPAIDTATATELAERVGESPANCSWHLRQLAKYGYIEEAPGGVGRERRWRAVLVERDWDAPDADADFTAARDVASDMLFDHEYQAYRGRRAWRSSEPAQWLRAEFSLQALGWCTADELTAINAQILELLAPTFERLTNPAARPPDARLIRFVGWGIPARPYQNPAQDPAQDPAKESHA
jgi:DNA-binding transcriptional ArsR family regulator